MFFLTNMFKGIFQPEFFLIIFLNKYFDFLKYLFFYYIFVYIFNLGGFWKGGGHGMTENKSVGWHTHHHMAATASRVEAAQ